MTRADANRLARKLGAPPIPKPPSVPRGMNDTERKYLGHLHILLLIGRISDHSQHEPETMVLANNVRYKPDFWYERLDGTRVYVEVKGTKNGKIYYRTERGRLKPIWAAQRGYRIVIAWCVDGQWREELVRA